MSWTKIDDRLLTHVKMRRARARIGDAALALWTASLVFTNQHELDGLIYGDMLSDFTSHADPASVAEVLVDVGLWVRDGENYRIHDYLSYNESKAQRDQKRIDERQRKADAIAKKRNGKKGAAAGKTGANPTPSPPSSPPSESSARKPAGKEQTHDGFQPGSAPELNPLTNPNQPIPNLTTTSSSSGDGCALATVSGPPMAQTSNPDAAKILERLQSHEILRPIATVRHAERMAKWTMSAKKLDWLLATVDELARVATSRDVSNTPWDIATLTDKLETFASRAAAPRPGVTPGGVGGGQEDPAPARRGPSPGDVEAMRDAFPERFNADGSLRAAP